MEILQGFVDAVVGIFNSSGLTALNWQNYVMIGISFILLYLAIKKQYEPLLLLPIAFGMLLVNLCPGIMAPQSTELLPAFLPYPFEACASRSPFFSLSGRRGGRASAIGWISRFSPMTLGNFSF